MWTLNFIMEAVPTLAAVMLIFYVGRSRHGATAFQRFLVTIGVKQTVLADEIEEWVAQSETLSQEENQESMKYFNERIRKEVFDSAQAAANADTTQNGGARSLGRNSLDFLAFAAGVGAILLQGPEMVALFQRAVGS